MAWSWRLCLALLPIAGAAVAIASGLELGGIVARGALLGEAADAERWLALAFGAAVQPFGWSALRHSRLVIDLAGLSCLGFGFVCRPRRIPFAEVVRWGHAVVTERGHRRRHARFALRNGSEHVVKLAMYTGSARVLEQLEQRLGPPASASATVTGVHFDDDA